jgi:hypothetical protein
MTNFGKEGRDKITGFTGIITAKCFYLYGCGQYLLTPKIDKDGKRQDSTWFDEGRIEIISEGINPKDVKAEKNGCEYREHPERN